MRPRVLVPVWFALGAVHFVAPALPQAEEAPAAQRAAAEGRHAAVEAALRAEFEAQGLVGLAVALVERGQVTREFHFGFADRADGIAVDGRTMFRWASISKPLTAIAAMQLALAERLDLERDVRAYLPEFPAKPWPITARQLLCHQGGVVHYTNGEVVRTEREYDVPHPFADVVLALDAFKDSPLVAEPGTQFAYTTHGYMLLGAVVQRAGGAPFAQQVRERIAVPAGMTTLRPDYQWEDIPHRAVGYVQLGEIVVPSTDTDVSWKLPGGGYVSTVGDLARFAAALMDDTLLPAAARDLMWTNQVTRDGKPTGYGLGFGVSQRDGRRRVAHSGSQEKTRTLLHAYPDQKRALVLMTNSEWAKLADCADVAWRALDG